MKKRKTSFDKIANVILLIIIIILAIVNIRMFVNNNKKEDNETENEVTLTAEEIVELANWTNTVTTDEENEEGMQRNISTMTERKRMQTYVGEFLNDIEDGDYEVAYACLNEKFRNTYFPSLDDFKKYCDETYSKSNSINYGDIDRQGEYYVLNTTIISNIGDANKTDQRFVVKENGNNDYEISFQIGEDKEE